MVCDEAQRRSVAYGKYQASQDRVNGISKPSTEYIAAFGADQFFPIWLYVVINSDVNDMHSRIQLVDALGKCIDLYLYIHYIIECHVTIFIQAQLKYHQRDHTTGLVWRVLCQLLPNGKRIKQNTIRSTIVLIAEDFAFIFYG